jgi:hypothetical protein
MSVNSFGGKREEAGTTGLRIDKSKREGKDWSI